MSSAASFRSLLDAAQRGDATKTKRALASLGAGGIRQLFFNHCSSSVHDPLVVSASLGHASVVEVILNAFVDNINDKILERGIEQSAFSSDNNSNAHHVLLRSSQDQKTSFLTIAIRNGHVCVVRSFVTVLVAIFSSPLRDSNNTVTSTFISLFNSEDSDGHTPLSLAISENQLAIVELLLAINRHHHPSNDNILDCNGFGLGCSTKRYASYLWHVSSSGDLEVVRLLLASKKSGTPLDVNLPSLYGTTPLMIACQKGRRQIVEELLLVGAENIDIFLTDSNDGGKTSLIFAAENGHAGVVEILMNHLWAAEENNYSMEKRREFVNHRDRATGDTALIAAARGGHEEVVRVLLRERGAEKSICDVNLQNSSTGLTALAVASFRGFVGVVEALLGARSGDINVTIAGFNNGGYQAIHLAASQNHDEVIKKLVEHASSKSLPLTECRTLRGGRTPLFCACCEGATAAVEMILRLVSSDPSEVDDLVVHDNDVGDDGLNCCFVVCQKGYVDILCILLSACPSLDPFNTEMTARKSDQCSCLAIAAQYGRDEVVQILLMRARVSLMTKISRNKRDSSVHSSRSSASSLSSVDEEEAESFGNETRRQQALRRLVDSPSLDGVTPVYRSCDRGFASTVSLLLSAGCGGDSPTSNGWRPLAVSVYKGHLDCVAELLTHLSVNVNASLPTSESTALHLACSSKYISEEDVKFTSSNGFASPSRQRQRQHRRRRAAATKRRKMMDQAMTEHRNNNNNNDDDGHDDDDDDLTNSSESDDDDEIADRKCDDPLTSLMSLRERIVRLLLQCGADPNAQTVPAGVFPLFLCAQENHVGCARALVEAGADVTLRTQKGFTALDVARACNHQEVARFLELFEGEIGSKRNSDEKKETFTTEKQHDQKNRLVEHVATLVKLLFIEREFLAKTYLGEIELEFESCCVGSWITRFITNGGA